MLAHHTRAIVDAEGKLHIGAIPFAAGETVEVIVYPSTIPQTNGASYPLRNTPVTYIDPFEPVSESDWESAQ